eukprot:s1_g2088.t1
MGNIAERQPVFNKRPVASSVHTYGALSLPLIPVNTDKKPAIKNWRQGKWVTPISAGRCDWLAEKFAEHNLAVLCGRQAGITVVDVDEQGSEALEAALERFGDTPLVAKTPSGGWHLYYRYRNEGNPNLRKSHGLPIDIKGEGGIVLLPPSRTSKGVYTWERGDPYRLLSGGERALPFMDPLPAASPDTPNPSKEGSRNNDLFKELAKRVAQDKATYHAKGLDGVLELGLALNDLLCDPPLDQHEVVTITRSVWERLERGDLYAGGKGSMCVVPINEVALCASCADALVLYMYLISNWAVLKHSKGFPVATLAMAQKETIPGWKRSRYIKALNHLCSVDLLKMTRQGQQGKASLFVFGSASRRRQRMTIPTPEDAARFLSEFGGMAQGEAENCLAQLIQVDLIGEPSSPLSAKQAAIVAIAWLTRVNGTPSDLLSAGDLCINHVESYPEHEGTPLPKPILEALGPVEALAAYIRQMRVRPAGDKTKPTLSTFSLATSPNGQSFSAMFVHDTGTKEASITSITWTLPDMTGSALGLINRSVWLSGEVIEFLATGGDERSLTNNDDFEAWDKPQVIH